MSVDMCIPAVPQSCGSVHSVPSVNPQSHLAPGAHGLGFCAPRSVLGPQQRYVSTLGAVGTRQTRVAAEMSSREVPGLSVTGCWALTVLQVLA